MSVIRYRRRTASTPIALTTELLVAAITAGLFATFGNWIVALVAEGIALTVRIPILLRARQPR